MQKAALQQLSDLAANCGFAKVGNSRFCNFAFSPPPRSSSAPQNGNRLEEQGAHQEARPPCLGLRKPLPAAGRQALPVPGAANEQQLQQSHSQAADGPAAAAGAAVDVETCNAHAEGGEQDCGGGGKHRGRSPHAPNPQDVRLRAALFGNCAETHFGGGRRMFDFRPVGAEGPQGLQLRAAAGLDSAGS